MIVIGDIIIIIIIISDKGRISIMKKTARAIRNYNPITSLFNSEIFYNATRKNMIEDILEKDSKESFLIQISEFAPYIINLHYKYCVKNKIIPKRISYWVTKDDVNNTMDILKSVFNTNASSANEYGIVIYPKLSQKKTPACLRMKMEWFNSSIAKK